MNPALREGSPAIHGRPAREGRIRKLIAFLALLILCWAASLPARAENRLALVIGQIAALRKAVADARACAGTLRGKGYSVSEGYDVKTFDLEAKVAAVVHAVGYSPDGRMLASGSADGVIGLLDATSGPRSSRAVTKASLTPRRTLRADANPRAVFQVVRGTEFSPMDDFIALDRRDSLFGGAANQNANTQ
ncbi:MAG: hypothetical protein WAV18_01270 [Roseiarcus sp.]